MRYKSSMYNIYYPKNDEIYVYNSYTEALVKLDNKHYAMLRNLKSCSQELLKQFYDLGLIVPSSLNEFDQINRNLEKFRSDEKSLSCTILTTINCNCVCPYCFEKDKHGCNLDTDIEDDIAKYIQKNFADIERLDITWFGGEPLLNLNSICSLTSKLKDVMHGSVNSSIVTNGVLLNKACVDKLVKNNVTLAQITLDGPKLYHDSRRILKNGLPTYNLILENIKYASQFMNITVRVNVDQNNLYSIEEILDDLSNKNINNIGIYVAPIMLDEESKKSELTEVSNDDLLKAKYAFSKKAIKEGYKVRIIDRSINELCGAIRTNTIVIRPDGTVCKCWEDVDRDNEIQYESINHYNYKSGTATKWLNYTPYGDECTTCALYPICLGGCPKRFMDGHKRQCTVYKNHSDLLVPLLIDNQLRKA